MAEVIREDRATGLQLLAEQRREPDGDMVTLYSFRAQRGLPGHLAPADAADRAAALAAFYHIIEWLTYEPGQ